MLYDVVPGQVFEIEFEIAAAHEGAYNARQDGQCKGDVIVFSESNGESKSKDVTSVMRLGEYVSKHCKVEHVFMNVQDGVIREDIEGRTR